MTDEEKQIVKDMSKLICDMMLKQSVLQAVLVKHVPDWLAKVASVISSPDLSAHYLPKAVKRISAMNVRGVFDLLYVHRRSFALDFKFKILSTRGGPAPVSYSSSRGKRKLKLDPTRGTIPAPGTIFTCQNQEVSDLPVFALPIAVSE